MLKLDLGRNISTKCFVLFVVVCCLFLFFACFFFFFKCLIICLGWWVDLGFKAGEASWYFFLSDRKIYCLKFKKFIIIDYNGIESRR